MNLSIADYLIGITIWIVTSAYDFFVAAFSSIPFVLIFVGYCICRAIENNKIH
jgi:hypothetical protein